MPTGFELARLSAACQTWDIFASFRRRRRGLQKIILFLRTPRVSFRQMQKSLFQVSSTCAHQNKCRCMLCALHGNFFSLQFLQSLQRKSDYYQLFEDLFQPCIARYIGHCSASSLSTFESFLFGLRLFSACRKSTCKFEVDIDHPLSVR